MAADLAARANNLADLHSSHPSFLKQLNIKPIEGDFLMSQQLSLLLLHLAQSAGYLVPVLFYIWIGKKVIDLLTPYDDDKLIEDSGFLSVSFRNVGFYIGLAVAMLGPLIGESKGFWSDLKLEFLDGGFALALMLFARVINEVFVLPTVKNDDEIAKNNIAVGIVEFGSYLASGLILNGAFTGEGGGVLSGIVFFFAGQLALLALLGLYKAVSRAHLKDLVGKGNVAAGIAVAGILISFGFILRASIAGPFTGWVTDLSAFGISAVSGYVLIVFFGKIADWIFLPSTDVYTEIVHDQNAAALLLTAGLSIAMSLVVSAVL